MDQGEGERGWCESMKGFDDFGRKVDGCYSGIR
jgi:hypothetical protein